MYASSYYRSFGFPSNKLIPSKVNEWRLIQMSELECVGFICVLTLTYSFIYLYCDCVLIKMVFICKRRLTSNMVLVTLSLILYVLVLTLIYLHFNCLSSSCWVVFDEHSKSKDLQNEEYNLINILSIRFIFLSTVLVLLFFFNLL